MGPGSRASRLAGMTQECEGTPSPCHLPCHTRRTASSTCHGPAASREAPGRRRRPRHLRRHPRLITRLSCHPGRTAARHPCHPGRGAAPCGAPQTRDPTSYGKPRCTAPGFYLAPISSPGLILSLSKDARRIASFTRHGPRRAGHPAKQNERPGRTTGPFLFAGTKPRHAGWHEGRRHPGQGANPCAISQSSWPPRW